MDPTRWKRIGAIYQSALEQPAEERPVFLRGACEGDEGLVKEPAQSYVAVVGDCTRVKNRLKALFRGRGIDWDGSAVYSVDDRGEWLGKLDGAAVRARAERLWKQLDCLVPITEEAESELVAEGRKQAATKILRGIPGIGPVRGAVILGVAGTPHRFRTKRQFWA